MTTQFPIKCKCPNCGTEYTYLKIMSVFIRNQEDAERIKSLINYEKTCECGKVFDMSKNEIYLDKDINVRGNLDENTTIRLREVIKGFCRIK